MPLLTFVLGGGLDGPWVGNFVDFIINILKSRPCTSEDMLGISSHLSVLLSP